MALTTCLNYKKDQTVRFAARTYKKYSFDKAKTYYNSVNRNTIFQYNDPNLAWSALKTLIIKCANKFCPLVKITSKLNQPKWFTNELLELIEERDQAFTKAYDTKLPKDLISAKAIRNARSDFIKDKLSQTSDNPRKFWRELNSLIKQKASSSSIQLVNEAGTQIAPHEVPEHINTYFSTIGPSLAKQFTSCPDSNQSPQSSCSSSLATNHLTSPPPSRPTMTTVFHILTNLPCPPFLLNTSLNQHYLKKLKPLTFISLVVFQI